MATVWENQYAHRMQRMGSSVIRELLKLTEQPDFISFAGGLPAPEVFPIAQVSAAADTLMKEMPAQALQYSTTEGYRPLREWIVQRMQRMATQTGAGRSIGLNTDNILVTSGSQQALDLIGKLFINPGDHVVVEAPTYLGALQAWNTYEADYVTVPADEHGMVVDALDEALKTHPKFIYLVPSFHNPTGVTLALERRKQLLEIAARAGVPVIEDDPYGQLRFEGAELPTLFTLDAQGGKASDAYQGNVIYLSTFSKILAPGLRVAWAAAPPDVLRKLVQAKQGTDLQTSTFTQMLTYEVAREGYLDEHIEIIRATYRERRNAMLDAMSDYLPAGVTWNKPEGGMFLWCVLPEGMSSARLLEGCVECRVAFVPGNAFYPCGGGENTMRLNFSNARPAVIREGIARLGDAIRRLMA